MGKRKVEIIVALDNMNVKRALKLAKKLQGPGVLFKRHDFFGTEAGIRKFGKIMIDSKFYDIPKTVGTRVKARAKQRPAFITVHAGGGIKMMKAAVKNSGGAKILAVTVLSSFSEDDCLRAMGGSIKIKTMYYAYDAVEAGVYGIVCPAKTLKFLSMFPELKKIKKFVPGIRPVWHLDPDDDQASRATIAEAVEAGADYLIIGRPITKARNPKKALKRVRKEIKDTLRRIKKQGRNNEK